MYIYIRSRIEKRREIDTKRDATHGWTRKRGRGKRFARTSFTSSSSSSSSSPHHLLHVFLIVIVSPKTQTNLRDAERERHTHRERDSRERRTPTKRATPTRILLPSVVFAFPSLETQLFSERDTLKVKDSSEIQKTVENVRKKNTHVR